MDTVVNTVEEILNAIDVSQPRSPQNDNRNDSTIITTVAITTIFAATEEITLVVTEEVITIVKITILTN